MTTPGLGTSSKTSRDAGRAMPAGLHIVVRSDERTALVEVRGQLRPDLVHEVEEVVRRTQLVVGEHLVLDLTRAEVSLDTAALVCRLAADVEKGAGFEVRVRPHRAPDRPPLALAGQGGRTAGG